MLNFYACLSLIMLSVQMETDSVYRSSARGPLQTTLVLHSTHYVILEYNPTYSWIFNTGKATTLVPAELKKLGALLSTAVQQHNGQTSKSDYQVHGLDNFYYQLVPAVNARGEKEVWINAFCQKPEARWTKEQIEVQDGGNCYFQVKINLTLGIACDFRVNGYA